MSKRWQATALQKAFGYFILPRFLPVEPIECLRNEFGKIGLQRQVARRQSAGDHNDAALRTIDRVAQRHGPDPEDRLRDAMHGIR